MLVAAARHVLVLGDSLCFHGPERTEIPTDPRTFPQALAARLAAGADGADGYGDSDGGGQVEVDLLARPGWTARDAWWALTKDPVAWGVYLPRSDALVLAVGGMDQLPAAVPTWLREGIAYVRPGGLRRRVRRGYLTLSPAVIRTVNGRLRQLPQVATDRYLTRIVAAARHWRPGLPIVLVGPSPWTASIYPSWRTHAPAVAAARSWAAAQQVGFVDTDPIVCPTLHDGTANPDGMHWAWSAHRGIAVAAAGELRRQGWSGRASS